jgi:hypothetical protein
MSNLFNNKYYNQLFGGKRDREESEDTRDRLERIFGGADEEASETTMDSDASEVTEDTEVRLNRIFGGEPKGRKGTGKPRVTGKRVSDEELLRRHGDGGLTADGRQIFVFRNGAKAVRDDNGRFVIIAGADAATLEEYRNRPRKPKKLVSNEQADRAFKAYWNQKLVQAARYNAQKGLDRDPKTGKRTYRLDSKTGERVLRRQRASKVLAVKRAQKRSMKYSKKDATGKWLLDESSPRGYLYLQKERILRNARGEPLMRRKDGKVSVRRAGVARHGWSGIAPVNPGTYSKGKANPDRIRQLKAYTASRKGVSTALPRGPKYGDVDVSTIRAANRIAARNATVASRRGARQGSRLAAVPRPAKGAAAAPAMELL